MTKDSRLVNSRWFKVLVSALLLVIILLVATPTALKHIVTQRIAPSYGLNLSMATPDITWHQAAITLDAIELRDDRDQVLVRIGNLAVDANLAALFRGEVQLESVSITELDVNVDSADGDSNLQRQLTLVNEKLALQSSTTEMVEPSEEDSEPWRFSLLSFQLQRASLGFSDQQHPNPPAKELAVIERLEIDGLMVDPILERVDIDSIRSSSLVANGWVSENGDVNVNRLLGSVIPVANQDISKIETATEVALVDQSASSSSDATDSPIADQTSEEDQGIAASPSDPVVSDPTSEGWIVALHQVAINNYQLNFWDLSLEREANYQLGPIDISLENFETKPFQEADVNFQASLGGESSITIDGKLQLIPLVSDANITISQLELSQFQPYLDSVTWADIEQGSITLNGHLNANMVGEGSPTVEYLGDVSVDNLRLIDRRDGSFIAGHESLQVIGLDFNLGNMMVRAEEAALIDSELTLSINSDGEFSLLSLARVSEETLIEEGKKVEEVGAQFGLAVQVARVENGQFRFSDDSLTSPFDMTIGLDHIQVNGVSSVKRPESAIARMNFGRAGILEFDGATQDDNTVATYRIADLPMANISGYIAALSGYEVQRGTFNLDGRYTISDSALAVDNELKVRSFELGRAIRDENTLPLPLATAMLSDSNGDIELSLPIRGNLDDPSFSVGSVVAEVMTQAIINAATSPFTLLGSLVGRDDLNLVLFSPNSSELRESEKLKLDHLVEALLSKPDLVLRITPTAHNSLDTDQPQPLAEREQERLESLADKRAQTIVSYLVDETQLDEGRIQVINPVRTSAPTAEVELILSIELAVE